MAIKKIKEIIESLGEKVDNVQDLPVRPNLTAQRLQKTFDKNVDAIIHAIDGDEGESNGLIDSIQANISQAGGGDMSEAEYATGENPASSNFPVDKALYAATALADKNGQDITTTYLPIGAGAAHPVTGSLYLTEQTHGGMSIDFTQVDEESNLPANTWTQLRSVSITPGIWLIVGSVVFRGGTSATAHIIVGTDSTQWQGRTTTEIPSNSNTLVGCQAVLLTQTNSNATIKLLGNATSTTPITRRALRAVQLA